MMLGIFPKFIYFFLAWHIFVQAFKETWAHVKLKPVITSTPPLPQNKKQTYRAKKGGEGIVICRRAIHAFNISILL